MRALLCLLLPLTVFAADRPNVLWFVVDDMSANFGCYGEQTIATPNVDRLAKEGVRFSRAYVTAPVCSPCRSALITGMYQTTIGAQHHRSGRGELKIHLPAEITPTPKLFQQGGYFTCIGSGLPDLDFRGLPFGAAKGKKAKASGANRLGKTDYNFEWDASIYDSHDWSGRKAGQPFFMQVQLHGGKLREGSDAARVQFRERIVRELGAGTDPNKVTLPPYYPRDPVLLQDWADYLDSARLTDMHVGRVLARLEKEGLLANTLIVFMTDHGISHARGKQFLYEEGAHIPLVIRGPGIPAGVVRPDLVEQIDLAALSLAAAGLGVPAWMQGKDILAPNYAKREEAFSARDRCDETTEKIRSLRTDKFIYILNFHPERPLLQPCAYKDGKQIVQQLRELHAAGKLSELTEKLLFSPTRPREELYELAADRWQVRNLAEDPAYAAVLAEHRQRLDAKMIATKDPGPESMAMYDSDMKPYVGKGNPEVERNIAQMKRWAAEGK
ncbi:MAG: sulfatase [Verrucomicrobia bacterium]|nr:sulfatase [Verrucomicrobiota bacterium]